MTTIKNALKQALPARVVTNDPSRPLCPSCHGLKFLAYDVRPTDPLFGKTCPCPCSREERDAARRAQILAQSRMPAGLRRSARFDLLDCSGKSGFQESVDYAKDPGEQWLILAGGYGKNKTYLAAAICNELINRGEEAVFSYVPDLLDHLRSTFRPGAEADYDELFDAVRQARLLALDDLGAEKRSDWANEKFRQIVSYREHEGLPMVITTNLTKKAFDARLSSRLSGSRVLWVEVGR